MPTTPHTVSVIFQTPVPNLSSDNPHGRACSHCAPCRGAADRLGGGGSAFQRRYRQPPRSRYTDPIVEHGRGGRPAPAGGGPRIRHFPDTCPAAEREPLLQQLARGV